MSPSFRLKNACKVARTPVSVPLSNRIIRDIDLHSIRCSRYQRPTTRESEFVTQIHSHKIFLLAVLGSRTQLMGMYCFYTPSIYHAHQKSGHNWGLRGKIPFPFMFLFSPPHHVLLNLLHQDEPLLYKQHPWEL